MSCYYTSEPEYPEIFYKIKNENLKSLYEAFKLLNIITVVPLKFKNTNAADSMIGHPFSSALCDVEEVKDDQYKFGSLFINGIKILMDFLRSPQILPKKAKDVKVLEKLLLFLETGETLAEKLKDCSIKCKESSLAVVLANHLFSKLSLNPAFSIDKFYQDKSPFCPCGCGDTISPKYGDTSIGNEKVWHGRPHVILGGGVHVEGDLRKPRSPEGKSFEEVKADGQAVDQVIAQTIVFSFLQQASHPEYSNFLIPGITVCKSELLFYFYDSRNDVLLASSPVNLLTRFGEFNWVSALAAWMVVNYQRLSTGLTGCLATITKSNFFRLAERKFEIYQKELRIGCVDYCLKRKLNIQKMDLSLPKTKYMKELEDVLKEGED